MTEFLGHRGILNTESLFKERVYWDLSQPHHPPPFYLCGDAEGRRSSCWTPGCDCSPRRVQAGESALAAAWPVGLCRTPEECLSGVPNVFRAVWNCVESSEDLRGHGVPSNPH